MLITLQNTNKMIKLPSLDIVIVNWNSSTQLMECLKSIISTDRDSFKLNRVIIVDNASTDRSMEGVDKIDLPINIIYNSTNKGFGTACNQGARECNTDYILFLNPDTQLYSDSLHIPMQFMQKSENQTVGICSIKLVGKTHVQRNCARSPTPGILLGSSLGFDKLLPQIVPSHFMIEFDHESSRAVDQVIGAFFLIRRHLFEDLNGFDEKFFVYFEEVDLCFRAKQKGWSSFYCADTTAFHRGGGSSSQVKALRLFYSLRSRTLYSFKHFYRIQAWIIYLVSMFIEPFVRIVYCLLRGKFKDAWFTIEGFFYFLCSFKDILIKIHS
jgi:N-acetylglucosaminyl-diphospho-decaprenol L-rhamnosyltransferase